MNIAFIHAKEHSTRLPEKNIKKLGNLPLVAHVLVTSSKSGLFDEIVIDSDSDKIIAIGYLNGATKHLKREKHQATNDFTGDDLAYWQARNFSESDICVQIVPTSPFITTDTLKKAVSILENDYAYNSVVGIRKERQFLFKDFPTEEPLLNSFELPPTLIETTGLYASHTKSILESKKRTNFPVFGLELSKIEAIDINTIEDFGFAEIVWRGLHDNNS